MLIDKLKVLINSTDIEIVDVTGYKVTYHVPYDNVGRVMILEGSTEDEIITSFVEQINSELNAMISHLNDCKLHNDQTGKCTTYQVFCG